MRMVLAALVLLATCYAASAATADDDTVQALRSWGWEGVWSMDCTKPADEALRTVHIIPQDALPVATYLFHGKLLQTSVIARARIDTEDDRRLDVASKTETGVTNSVAASVLLKAADGSYVNWLVYGTTTADIDVPANRMLPAGLKRGESVTFTSVENGLILTPEGQVISKQPRFAKCE